MIEASLQNLTNVIEKHMGESHSCNLVWTEEPSREREGQRRDISYLRMTNVSISDTTYHKKNLKRVIRSGEESVQLKLIPTTLDLEWSIPLKSGMHSLFKVIPKIQSASISGELNFGLNLDYNGQNFPISINIESEGEIPIPMVDGDVIEQSTPTIVVNMRMATYSIIYEENVGLLTSISHTTTDVNTQAMSVSQNQVGCK